MLRFHRILQDVDLPVGQAIQLVDGLVYRLVRPLDLLLQHLGTFLRLDVALQTGLDVRDAGQRQIAQAITSEFVFIAVSRQLPNPPGSSTATGRRAR